LLNKRLIFGSHADRSLNRPNAVWRSSRIGELSNLIRSNHRSCAAKLPNTPAFAAQIKGQVPDAAWNAGSATCPQAYHND
jgi:hypothetical protein